MKLFDTHCHFEKADAENIRETLVRARQAGVERLMAVGGNDELNASALLAASLTGDDIPRVALALGFDQSSDRLSSLPESNPAAIGEIGLDYHYYADTRKRQLEVFSAQLEQASERHLPVVIHTREADEDTLAVLNEIPSFGIIHCFTGNPGFCKRLLDLGFYISFSGIVTFKAADNVRESMRVVPDDRILIETDSPFLAPVPMRGKPNEPAFIRHTCEFIANLRGVSPDAFAELTFINSSNILKPNV